MEQALPSTLGNFLCSGYMHSGTLSMLNGPVCGSHLSDRFDTSEGGFAMCPFRCHLLPRATATYLSTILYAWLLLEPWTNRRRTETSDLDLMCNVWLPCKNGKYIPGSCFQASHQIYLTISFLLSIVRLYIDQSASQSINCVQKECNDH